MQLLHRPMRLSDIDDAIKIICDGFLYPAPEDRRKLAALWREIILQESGITIVIEDSDAPPRERFLYIALGICITDELAARLKTGTAPYVSCQILELWQQGHAPFLSQAQMARANSGDGLTLLILHSGYLPAALHPVTGRALRDYIESYAYYGLGGCNYKEVLAGVYGEFCRNWIQGAGLRVRNDYAEYFRASGEKPVPGRYPRLMGCDRDEAARQDGTTIRQAMLTAPPRFYFSAAERAVLMLALQGLTDDEIAAMLCLSVPTIRKRWESIYDRVLDVEPQRLALTPSAPGGTAQKKRRLLEYVRQNMQETRPYARLAPSDKKAPGAMHRALAKR